MIIVPIFLYGARIGDIEFELLDKANASGKLRRVNLPDHPELKGELEMHLTKNPDGISMSGGHSPTDIGNYADGIVYVLEYLGQSYDITYDDSDLPWPDYPDGAIP